MIRYIQHAVLAVTLITALATVAEAQQPRPPIRIPEGVKALRGLEYAKAGEKPLLLDLYLPESPSGKLPLVIWVHGGAWQSGSKEQTPALFLTERGYAVASINYRLSGEAIFPAQIEDCKAAVRWLRANAAQYNLDPDRFGAWGSSAGGHLVALLGTSGGVRDLEGTVGGNAGVSSRVQAVCDWFGPTDLLQMSTMDGSGTGSGHDSPNSPESRLIGGAIQENREKAARANPIVYITADDPPFLIMHGDSDRTVPHGQSRLLHEKLQSAGVPSELVIVPGAGHGLGGPEIMARVEAFFEKTLRKK